MSHAKDRAAAAFAKKQKAKDKATPGDEKDKKLPPWLNKKK